MDQDNPFAETQPEPEDEANEQLDKEGRLVEPAEIVELEKDTQPQEVVQSMFVKMGMVYDEQRAKAIARLITGQTPKSVIRKRVGRGGGEFSYVPGWYVRKMLNLIFPFQWDFEVLPIKSGEMFYMTAKQVIVMGKLTIRDLNNQPRIVKTETGKKDIAYLKGKDGKPSTIPLDLGNDIKAANTDALKRCAALLGIGADLYEGE